MNNPNNQADRPWTETELQLLAAGLSNAEVAKRTGRSQAAVRGKRQRLAKQVVKVAEQNFQLPPPEFDLLPPVTVPEDPYEADKARASGDFWKKEHDALKRKYEKSLREQAAVERLVSIARELAPKAYTALPPVARITAGKGKPQSALLFLSDTHVGKVVDPSQTMGFGQYNFDLFLARLKLYEEAVASILRDHVTTDVQELVIAMGGDMLDGNLKHAAEVGQQVTLFQQYYGAGHAFAQFIRNLAPLVPQVRIYCTVGNHTRWGDQHKMPTDNRFSNLDSFVYAYTAALTRDLGNVNWTMDAQPFALFDVQGFLFHLSHGDQLRGGDRALGIPNHAVGRMVSSTAQLYGKDGSPSPHYYLVGHLHREIVLPHARGSVIVNGGFPGIDGFGLAGGFSPVDPKQVFFLVHPKYGKTATYDIELKFAQVATQRPYDIPGFI